MLVIMATIAISYHFYIGCYPVTGPGKATNFASFFSDMTMPFLTLITALSLIITLLQNNQAMKTHKEQIEKQSKKEIFNNYLSSFDNYWSSFKRNSETTIGDTDLSLMNIRNFLAKDNEGLSEKEDKQYREILDVINTYDHAENETIARSNIKADIVLIKFQYEQSIEVLKKAIDNADPADRIALTPSTNKVFNIMTLLCRLNIISKNAAISLSKKITIH